MNIFVVSLLVPFSHGKGSRVSLFRMEMEISLGLALGGKGEGVRLCRLLSQATITLKQSLANMELWGSHGSLRGYQHGFALMLEGEVSFQTWPCALYHRAF